MRENTLEGVSHEEGLSTDDEETNSEIVARQQSIGEFYDTFNASKKRRQEISQEPLEINKNIRFDR